MTPNLLVEALGTVVEIDLAGLPDDDADAVREAWRDALADPPVVEQAKRDETRQTPVVAPAAVADRTRMLSDLSQSVTLAALEHRRGELWMLHASGVAADDGRVVVLVGPSGRGKTTAARTLAAHFGYVSDESVAIDDQGRVWPYRKPLSVIERQGAPKTQRPPSELGLLPLPDAALRVAAIVLLDRVGHGRERAAIETVDLGDALADLVSQSSYLTAMSAPLHSIAALAESTGGIRRVTYSESTSLPEAVHALLAESTQLPAVPAPHVLSTTPAPPVVERVKRGETPTPTPRYSRTPVVDALNLTDPDRIAILQAADHGTGSLHVLAGVAPAVWRAADVASVSDLTSAAIATYGQPDGDPVAIVAAAADELVEAGLLGTHTAGGASAMMSPGSTATGSSRSP